jgi:hypothetical protein
MSAPRQPKGGVGAGVGLLRLCSQTGVGLAAGYFPKQPGFLSNDATVLRRNGS